MYFFDLEGRYPIFVAQSIMVIFQMISIMYMFEIIRSALPWRKWLPNIRISVWRTKLLTVCCITSYDHVLLSGVPQVNQSWHQKKSSVIFIAFVIKNTLKNQRRIPMFKPCLKYQKLWKNMVIQWTRASVSMLDLLLEQYLLFMSSRHSQPSISLKNTFHL